MRNNLARRLIGSVLVAAVITGLAWAGLGAGVFGGFQLRLVDSLFPGVDAVPRIVVVAIDDRSLREVDQRWPWDRALHGRIIERLAADGATLIGYDITFSEPSDSENDQALGAVITSAGNVVPGAAVEFSRKAAGDRPALQAVQADLPIPEVAAGAAAIGHVNVRPDPDGVVRSIPLVAEGPNGDLIPSLSFALYELDRGLSGPLTLRDDGVGAGGVLIPTQQQSTMDVNYAPGFRTYSAVDVLNGAIPAGTFRDRIVLIGATAIGLGDFKQTPLDKAAGQPGVLVHANALNTMLTGAFLAPASTPVNVAWVFVVAFLVALAVAFLRTWLSPVVALAFGAGFFAFAFRQFDSGRVLNMVYPALAVILAYLAALVIRYLTEVRERRRVTRTFTRYLATDVVDELLASPEDALATLKGVSRPLSILFSDLRGFTAASDGAEPVDVVAALNVYLDAMVRAVIAEGGTIDKFMGDCVMAFWNAPRAEPAHAEKAVRAAVRMLDNIDEAVRTKPETELLRVKGCGVGVATGEAVVGNIGSAERLDYTVVGDTVNTASRLCGVAGPGQVVVTEETAREIGDRFRMADLPPLAVKGKTLPLKVFQILREGQEAAEFAEGAVLDATEEKGHFEPVKAPPKAAGYAPIEPRPEEPSAGAEEPKRPER